MRKILLIILILMLVSVFGMAGSILDISRGWTNFSVNVSSSTSTLIRNAKANRKKAILVSNPTYIVYITSASYSVAVTTTTGFPLYPGSPPIILENYVGAIYGVAISTPAAPINIRGIETE